MIPEDYPEGLREENDPPSVETVSDNYNQDYDKVAMMVDEKHKQTIEGNKPEQTDGPKNENLWRMDYEFFLEQLEKRNSIRVSQKIENQNKI